MIVHERDLGWESWEPTEVENKGLVYWKTLISKDETPSDSLTLGVALIPAGEALLAHRHQQPELYIVLAGEGLVKIRDRAQTVSAGSYVFIPGNAAHSIQNTGSTDLQLNYVFSADSFGQVEYAFDI